MNGLLPPLLVTAAFAMALASAGRAIRFRALAVFVVIAGVVGLVRTPASWSDAAHFGCWISIIACGVAAHASLGARAAVIIAIGAGVAAGAVSDAFASVVLLAPVAVVTTFAARAVARRVPLAPKVAASWLIAVALLASLLQMLPVTPGYLPDHLE